MATIVFKDFSIQVVETQEELKDFVMHWDFIEVNEIIHNSLPTKKVLVNLSNVIFIRE
jgi:hypothetical protein